MQPRSLFLLGADDAEMRLIESLLRDAGQAFVPAAGAGGARLRPGEPPALAMQTLTDEGFGAVGTLYLVECAARAQDAGLRELARQAYGAEHVVVIDHHDTPEATFPPARFFEAASVGQVWRLLHGDATPPPEVVYEAAADHCLGAAFAGQCPGVERAALWAHCVQTRAATYGATAELLDAASATLQRAKPHPAFAERNLFVADLSSDPAERGSDWSAPDGSGVCYPLDYVGGPLVGSACGRAYLVRVKTRDGYAFRGGGGGDACAAARAWPQIAEELGCFGPDAARPQNAYAFPDRGLFGGTIRWEADGAPLFVEGDSDWRSDVLTDAGSDGDLLRIWGLTPQTRYKVFVARALPDTCRNGGLDVQPLRLACDPPTR